MVDRNCCTLTIPLAGRYASAKIFITLLMVSFMPVSSYWPSNISLVMSALCRNSNMYAPLRTNSFSNCTIPRNALSLHCVVIFYVLIVYYNLHSSSFNEAISCSSMANSCGVLFVKRVRFFTLLFVILLLTSSEMLALVERRLNKRYRSSLSASLVNLSIAKARLQS